MSFNASTSEVMADSVTKSSDIDMMSRTYARIASLSLRALIGGSLLSPPCVIST
mgnify:CR=1 FL=1